MIALKNKTSKGKFGEYYAKILLRAKGYSIIGDNFRSSFGEIDIIAKKNNALYFCEVKTRWSTKYGYPQESVNRNKLNKIIKTIHYYLKINKLKEDKINVLIISQIINKNVLYQKIILLD